MDVAVAATRRPVVSARGIIFWCRRSAAEPDKEGEIRHLIEQALSGQLKFPDGFATPWQLRASWPSEISAEEIGHASASFAAEHSTRQKSTGERGE
jgi:hypothetical protein